jgi:predicted DNA-binding protein
MTDSNMQRCNFFLPKELADELKELSERTGVPMSQIVRRVLQAHMDKQFPKPKVEA